MNIFKKYTYSWQEIGIFKIALLAIGILIGACWHEFWGSYFMPLAAVAIVASVYIMYVSFKQ